MKLIQLTTLLIVLFSLNGCGFRDEPDIEIKKAVLYSPEGEFKFKRDKKYSAQFHSNDGHYSISTSLFPIKNNSYLKIHSILNKSIYDVRIKFNFKNLYYQLNEEKKVSLHIKKINHTDFQIIAPTTMNYYMSDGDGLHITRRRHDITSKDKRKINKQTYRYYIPFSIDNKDYTIDITFKLKIKTSLEFGVPGGMP